MPHCTAPSLAGPGQIHLRESGAGLAEAPSARAGATGCIACGAADAEPFVRTRAQMSRNRTVFQFVRCRACSLVYLHSPPSDDELAAYYDDYLPHRGSAAWGRWAGVVERAQRGTDRRRVQSVMRTCAAAAPAVLDVGCGQPTFLAELKRAHPEVRAVGFDWSSAGWVGDERARWSGLELHEGALDAVQIDGQFDVLTMWHVLEHLRHPVETLAALRTRARAGGRVLIEVPNLASLTARLQGTGWAGFHTPRHMAAYTPRTLAAVLERAGWRDVRVWRHGTLDPYVLWWLGRMEQRGWPDGSLQHLFLPFVIGKVCATPLTAFDFLFPLGIMSAVATA